MFLEIKHILNKHIVQSLLYIWIHVFGKFITDKFFLKVYYFLHMKEKLDLLHPTTYTQKLQYLKLRNTNAIYSKMVDKYEVKKIVAEKLGNEYVIPLLGVWESFDRIDFDALPDKFVLKTTHDSGNVFICTDKKSIDFGLIKRKFDKAIKVNYFYKSREYPYKSIPPRIIAESFLSDGDSELLDYKFFCFQGKVEFFQIAGKVNGQSYLSYYDVHCNLLPFKTNSLEAYSFELPKEVGKMVEIANLLSEGIVHIRIDLYLVNNQIYFGEFTFHHCGGIIHFEPRVWNEKIGDLLKNLPE